MIGENLDEFTQEASCLMIIDGLQAFYVFSEFGVGVKFVACDCQ
jgi:hypothetical protein